jgi:hypothetical protein
MHWINWVIVAVYLVYVVWDGLRRTNIEGYFSPTAACPGGRWASR